MTEKSELKVTLSARMMSVDTGRPMVDAEPEVLLNTAGPCFSGSLWILPSQMVTPMKPTTGRERTPTWAPTSYGPPSPQTQRYDSGSPGHHRQAEETRHAKHGSQEEIRDLFRGEAPRARELDGEDQSDNAWIDLTQSHSLWMSWTSATPSSTRTCTMTTLRWSDHHP